MLQSGQTYSEVSMMEFDQKTHLPLRIDGGAWEKPAGHLQGVVADDDNNFLYMSFTDRLLKVDMHTGELTASVTGLLAGGIYGGGAHLGDLAFYRGKVYGSLEYKAAEKFYIAVFDTEKMTALDMDYKTGGVMTTMYMDEVVRDYVDDLDAGEHENAEASMGHRFGCSGIDGITFGPLPGDADGKTYMTVAYGVYSNPARRDNDYQVILAFDPEKFQGAPFDQNHPHEVGPALHKKLFVYTGNTTYGVQNLEYDRKTGDYWMIVYVGKKEGMSNFPVYIVDGKTAPVEKELRLGDEKNYGHMHGAVLELKKAGVLHAPSGVWGVTVRPDKADTGFVSLGDDYFYVATSGKTDGRQWGYVRLCRLDRATYTFTAVEA